MLDISIVIPIHNEENYLKTSVNLLLFELDKANVVGFELILVENGSTDQTCRIAKKLEKISEKIRLVEIEDSDYGAALKKGMLISRGKYIIMYDIDYWDVLFLRKTVLFMKEFEYDVIIGSKNLLLSKDERHIVRRIISQVFRLFLLLFFRLRVSDTHGPKAFRNDDNFKQLIKKTMFTRHIFDTELVIRCQKANLNIIEFPMAVVEKRPSSNKTILKRIPEAIIDLLWLWWEFNFTAKKKS